jgi:adenosylcobyric acid synthase
LLPIATTLYAEKTTRRVIGRLRFDRLLGQALAEIDFKGYEIHLGKTTYDEGAQVLAEVTREGIGGQVLDGAVNGNGWVWGTYVHGMFDEDGFRHAFLAAARSALGLAPPRQFATVSGQREQRLDRLAAHVRRSLDIDQIKRWIGMGVPDQPRGAAR